MRWRDMHTMAGQKGTTIPKGGINPFYGLPLWVLTSEEQWHCWTFPDTFDLGISPLGTMQDDTTISVSFQNEEEEETVLHLLGTFRAVEVLRARFLYSRIFNDLR
ncbi:hypothetical protein EVAR_72562_1 [Eumeta japonica]|uniref:Uncharacterized protein n=1 Tax=Eumeta variegata TaxID=151549 RepID=A0A4C1T9L6_EUMVA|nr:hypothetical protein EVAR_72562_1 [Eumeta japonica]